MSRKIKPATLEKINMIEKIKHISGQAVMNFDKSTSERLYKIDSVNLIIGDNGSGKTALIRSIIRDLTSSHAPEEYITTGKTDRLGVVYYTAAPFHRHMSAQKNDSIQFIDVSNSESKNQDFLSTAKDYIEVTEKLKIKNKLISTKIFDFTELAFNLIELLRPVRRSKLGIPFSENLESAVRDYERLQKYYLDLRSQQVGLEQQWYSADESNQEQKQIDVELSIIGSEIEDTASRIKCHNDKMIDIFIYECGVRTGISTIFWIATILVLSQSENLLKKRKLAKMIYTQDFAEIEDDKALSELWSSTLNLVKSFTRFLNKELPKSFTADRVKASYIIDVRSLLKCRVEPGLISAANKFGLVNIGYDNISSGEAAILHQITSIVHGIQELEKSNAKKNFLIFIDEGDLLLHLRWQQQYISLVSEKLSNLRSALNLRSIQLVIATHSPMLATEVLKPSVTRLKGKGAVPSFGAPLQKIVNYSFGTKSMGSIAQKTISRLCGKTELDATDAFIAKNIDDDYIRELIFRKANL